MPRIPRHSVLISTTIEFDPYSETFFEDPSEVYRWLRDEAPVYHSERYGFYALTRYADVLRAHKDWKTFSSTHGVSLDDIMTPGISLANSMITMDPPEHDRLRLLVSRAFTPRSMEKYEPLVRQVIAPFLEDLDGRDEFDIVTDYAAPFPVKVISTILGIPDDMHQQVRHWTDEMLHRETGHPQPSREAMKSAMTMGSFFFELAQHKRANPADDMMTTLVDAGLTDVEVANFSVLLAAAGSETVTKLIGSGVVLFARNRDQWKLVLDDPGLIPDAVEEALRYVPPSQYQGRYSLQEATFDGGTIPAEVPVILVTGAATRDPRAYPAPTPSTSVVISTWRSASASARTPASARTSPASRPASPSRRSARGGPTSRLTRAACVGCR
jgi:cytochrome P450